MKRRTIWIIANVIGFCFLALIYLQFRYFNESIQLRSEQFNESVQRSLYQAAHNLEVNESLDALQKQLKDSLSTAKTDLNYLALTNDTNHTHLDSLSTISTDIQINILNAKNSVFSTRSSIEKASQTLQEAVKKRYIYQKDLLDEVIYNILYNANEQPLESRINFKQLDEDLSEQLQNNGIDIPYHFTITTQDGRMIYKCPDFSIEDNDKPYKQVLFNNSSGSGEIGILTLYFPTRQSYFNSSYRIAIPTLLFTFILFCTFIFTLYTIFRQKRLTEIKTDFVNNMTHEFKTPLASINLAGQMLKDPAVRKIDSIVEKSVNAIVSESNRLRFLIDKVLEMSLYDKDVSMFKKKEMNIEILIQDTVNTFRVQTDSFGGSFTLDLKAKQSNVYVDEMHITNVLFNLMDNAIKYRKSNVPPQLQAKTWNDNRGFFYFSLTDNGIGIKKEDLKHIFDTYFRVHTANTHDVKGFGLGLAYVKKIIEAHDGTIYAESEYGKYTTFIIKLPFI